MGLKNQQKLQELFATSMITHQVLFKTEILLLNAYYGDMHYYISTTTFQGSLQVVVKKSSVKSSHKSETIFNMFSTIY